MFGRPVAICCNMLDDVGSNLKMGKFFVQHLDDVALVWPCSHNIVRLEHAHSL